MNGPPRGEDFELIEKLGLMLRPRNDRPEDWTRDIAMSIAPRVGGSALRYGVADRKPPTPGTVGAMLAEQLVQLSADGYVDRLEERLRELVSDVDIAEEFLVSAILRDVDEMLQLSGDIPGYSANQEQMREMIQHLEEDVELQAQFRANMERLEGPIEDAEFERRLDKWIQENPVLRELDPDEVADRWNRAELWRRLWSEYLSEDLIRAWQAARPLQ